jgi:hypothetical protein
VQKSTWLAIATYFSAAVLILFGALKLAKGDDQGMFVSWGYPAFMARVIGATELVAAALYIWKSGRFWAAGITAVVMAGAIITHAMVPEISIGPIAASLLALAIWIGYNNAPPWALRVIGKPN